MHNFISSTAARRAGLQFHDSRGAHVVVANGDRVACRSLARDVAIRIGEDFTVDCCSIPLDYYNMVLGVAWLRTLGPILWDFDDLCMAFWHHGRRVLWKGIGSTRTDIPPTESLHAARSTEPALLERLLDSYADVFAALAGLPSARPCDHRIHLKPAVGPVAIRPFRYHSSKRTSWRRSVRPCSSRALYDPARRCSQRRCCSSRNKTPPGGFVWTTAAQLGHGQGQVPHSRR
jgi:hypothetical protein